MNECPNCERAAHEPLWPRYTASCTDCAIRELAQSPGYFLSMQVGRLHDSYTKSLKAIFGNVKADYIAGHDRVKRAAAQLTQPRLL